jgi:hypothetical protein
MLKSLKKKNEGEDVVVLISKAVEHILEKMLRQE